MNSIAVWAIALRAVVNCVGLAVFASGLRERRLGPRGLSQKGRLLVRVAAFVLLCAVVVTIRMARLLFFADFLAVVAAFTLWLLATKHTTLRNALYVAIVVFLCLDLTVALANSAYYNLPTFSSPLWSVVMEACYAGFMLGLCYVLRRWAPTSDEPSVPHRSFLVLLLALAPYLLLRASDVFYEMEGPTGAMIEIVLVLTIVATFGAFVGNHATIVAATEKVRRLQLEMELQEHQRRFCVRKETMDEVNRRYHDMVRYARTFAQCQAQGQVDPGSLDAFLEERLTHDLPAAPMRDAGNDTLDMLIWETSERCAASDVRFVPVVDIGDVGAIAGFDLHAIVGNALENAVDAACRVPEHEKREVRLRVRQVRGMLFVTVSNHFVGPLRRDGDRLLSTKDASDGSPHGYGFENIRRAAENYGGSLTYAVDGDRFDLTAMVPLGA